MKELSKTPTNELITELSRLEREIDFKIMKYNLILNEMYKRFPMLEEQEEFKPKILSKKEY